MISDEDRLQLLATLVRKFPADDPRIDLGAQWERENAVLSVSLGRDGMFVTLNGCSGKFETASELIQTLEDVFADRLVGVIAYYKDSPVHSGLAPPSDPSAAFQGRDDRVPAVDSVHVQSWSGAIDEDRAFLFIGDHGL